MFYLQYAARNIWRNRRWSSFAIFSIAAGVATIVALRSLGLAIGDSLINNVRATNHGDITLSRDRNGGFGFTVQSPDDAPVFSESEIQSMTAWVNERGGQMSNYISTGAVQVTAVGRTSAGRPQFITAFFIDPQTYPPTQDIRAMDPADVALRDLFQGGNEVVISKNLADSQNIHVGDHVRVSGTTDEFIVRGIIPTEIEAGLNNLFAAFFGFAYIDISLADSLSLNPNPNAISLTLPENAAPRTLDESDQIKTELRGLLNQGRFTDIRTVPQLIEQNRTIADYTGRFIVVMGLGAMLIGGVGIVNTMLVMVRRRTEEIAALKTFGLKGRQVAALFMSEALLLGLVGSLVGGFFGIILSAGANAYGEALIQQSLVFRIYPEAILFGLALGLIVTAVFGVLPVLTATKIRPGIILRPNETHVPRAGVFQSLLALLFVVLSMGVIAGQILGNITWGVIGVAGTMIILGILIGLLWILVWLVGRMPAFGNVELRLALRNLRARRVRTATTLLAISAGMFALSSITFFGAGVRQILQTTLSQSLGGNVMIFPMLPAAIANPLIDSRLDSMEGVKSRTRFINYQGDIKAIDGTEVDTENSAEKREELLKEMGEAASKQDFGRMGEIGKQLDALQNYSLSLSIRDTTGSSFGAQSVIQGRNFTEEDRGKRVALLQQRDDVPDGLTVGTVLTLEIDHERYDFEIVGLMPGASSGGLQGGFAFGDLMVPPGSLPAAGNSDFQLTLADVQPEALDKVLLDLSALPLVFSIDITFIDGLLRRFIDQFSALPILVGLLSLGAAAVIMANTVALATLERRRQIGILKAVGLKGRRVLWIMLLENILVSLLGGILGVGLSALGVASMSILGLQDVTILVPTDSTPIAIALIVAAVLIGTIATFLSAQVAINERALNVLRYE